MKLVEEEETLTTSLKREVLRLVGLVLLVDVMFAAGYFLGNFRTASGPAKLAFTVVWTLMTLAVLIRGRSRVRKARLIRAGTSQD
jgi:hypothetical protein